jgi:hypothetical protein
MTQAVIDQVNSLADKQGWTELKFKNRFGVILPDTNRLAGVDGQVDDSDDSNKNSDNNSGTAGLYSY